MPSPKQRAAYESLKQRFAEVCNIRNAGKILGKDRETAMAPGSAPDRTRQLVTLAAVAHRMMNDPAVKQWLTEAEKNKAVLSAQDRRNLKLMRDKIEDSAMPENLAEASARLSSEGENLHTALRSTGNWGKMQGWYEKSFDIMRRIGADKQARRGFASVYEALLDNFSPGIKAADVTRELDKMEQALPAMIREARQKQAAEPQPIPLKGPFPKKQQAELLRRIVTAMGFDFNRGRFDVVDVHPSSGGTSDDTRFTTDYDEENFLEAVYSTIHETGHAMYDQNQPANWRYQPAGSHLGMAVHESQSRIMEMQACMTPEFFEYLEREARAVFGRPHDPALSAENLRRLKHRVQPSFIRVQADELTYPAHVILRHKLEKAVIEGRLQVRDLPQAWNSGMRQLLGITPPDPSKGCMQDVHWPAGLIGYFPAYTLGDMGAAQLFAAACRDKPEIRAALKNGNFTPLREWLRDNVHSKGALLTPDELFTQATGQPLNADFYLDHLSRRYLGRPYRPAIKLSGPAGPSNNLG